MLVELKRARSEAGSPLFSPVPVFWPSCPQRRARVSEAGVAVEAAAEAEVDRDLIAGVKVQTALLLLLTREPATLELEPATMMMISTTMRVRRRKVVAS
jgi:hypothetical protein